MSGKRDKWRPVLRNWIFKFSVLKVIPIRWTQLNSRQQADEAYLICNAGRAYYHSNKAATFQEPVQKSSFRGLGTPRRFFAICCKRDNTCDILFAFLHIKGSTLIGKNLLPFRVDHLSQLSMKEHQFHLIYLRTQHFKQTLSGKKHFKKFELNFSINSAYQWFSILKYECITALWEI